MADMEQVKARVNGSAEELEDLKPTYAKIEDDTTEVGGHIQTVAEQVGAMIPQLEAMREQVAALPFPQIQETVEALPILPASDTLTERKADTDQALRTSQHPAADQAATAFNNAIDKIGEAHGARENLVERTSDQQGAARTMGEKFDELLTAARALLDFNEQAGHANTQLQTANEEAQTSSAVAKEALDNFVATA